MKTEEAIEQFINKGGSIKSQEEIDYYYNDINLKNEFSIINDRDFIRKSISFIDNRMHLCGDRVTIKIAKSGSIYFIIKNQVARGMVRNILLEKLIEYKYNLSVEPIADMPMYWVYKANNDSKELLVWVDKKNGSYAMIYALDKGIEMLKNQQMTITYGKLKEQSYRKTGSKVYIKDKNEIYANNEPEEFEIRTNELEEMLNLVLSMKQRVISFEESELLKEIQSEIEMIV